MALLRGYFDDSETSGEILALAGYVGGADNWAVYNHLWTRVLEKHGVPYFHRKELSEQNGVFAKWYPASEHEPELAAFQADLAEVIGKSELRAFGSLVRIKHLNRFNAEHGLQLDAYSLAAYGCMLVLGREHFGDVIELTFDNPSKISSKLQRAKAYAESDTYYGPDGVYKRTIPTEMSKGCTFKEVIGIQAADFWAWEWRKHQLKLRDWFDDEEGKPADWEARWGHMRMFIKDRPITLRKSAKALLENAPFVGLVWDSKNLCDAHKARGGVWAIARGGRAGRA
jgi:hypothetical protein